MKNKVLENALKRTLLTGTNVNASNEAVPGTIVRVIFHKGNEPKQQDGNQQVITTHYDYYIFQTGNNYGYTCLQDPTDTNINMTDLGDIFYNLNVQHGFEGVRMETYNKQKHGIFLYNKDEAALPEDLTIA